jgi:hypothetical protein
MQHHMLAKFVQTNKHLPAEHRLCSAATQHASPHPSWAGGPHRCVLPYAPPPARPRKPLCTTVVNTTLVLIQPQGCAPACILCDLPQDEPPHPSISPRCSQTLTLKEPAANNQPTYV